MSKTTSFLIIGVGLTGLCVLGNIVAPPPSNDLPQQQVEGKAKPVEEDGPTVVSEEPPPIQPEKIVPAKDLRDYIDRKILADKIQGEKISFDIVLKSKPSESELHLLAEMIIAEHEGEFKRVFVVYYLPGMIIDDGGWAISHKRDHDAEIEFRILGQSKEAELYLQSTSLPRDWNVFGRWIDRNRDSGMLTFYRQNGQMMLQVIYNDNSEGYHKIKPIKVGGASGFEEVGDVNLKDTPKQWMITSNGSLQQMDYFENFGQKYGLPLSRFLPKELVRYRQWEDASGSFQVIAEFKSQNTKELVLVREDNAEELVVVIEQLSEVDQQWLRSERIRQTVQFKIEPQ